MTWERVEDGVWLYRDACLVYAVEGPRGVVVINAGTGRWLKHRDALPGPVRPVLCTHFFRDHTAGAAPAARAGIPVWAPYWEQEQFADPHGLFQRRETYLEYHNIWDFFAPVEPIPVSRWLLDDDTVSIAGLTVRVLPNPGVTVGAVTFLVERGARRLAFCGELIHSPGKLARIAPLQYDYNDLRGAVNVISAIEWLRAERPDALFPSLGQPLRRDADAALTALDASLRRALAGRPELMGELEKFSRDPLTRVTDHIWCSTFGGGGACWLLLSRSGKARDRLRESGGSPAGVQSASTSSPPSIAAHARRAAKTLRHRWDRRCRGDPLSRGSYRRHSLIATAVRHALLGG